MLFFTLGYSNFLQLQVLQLHHTVHTVGYADLQRYECSFHVSWSLMTCYCVVIMDDSSIVGCKPHIKEDSI